MTRGLFPYQEEGARWLASRERAGLHDEMGVGKTATLIRAINIVGGTRGLVIGPATLRDNFINEWGMFSTQKRRLTKGRTLKDYEAWAQGDFDILVTSYEMATKWISRWEGHGEILDFLVMDEAHYLKNVYSARARAVLGDGAAGSDGWVSWAVHAWWATGTPIPNNPVDIYTFLRFAGATYLSYGAFVGRYFDVGVFAPTLRNTEAVTLKNLINSCALRRTKSEVGLQLPAIHLTTVLLEGDTAEVKALLRCHPGAEKAILDAVDRGGLSFIDSEYIATIRRLIGTAKAVPYAWGLLEELKSSGDKRVVFGVSRAALEHVHERLTAGGIRGHIIYGATPEKARIAAVKDFQTNPTCQYLVGQIKSAGTGLTLTAACDIDLLESDWTPAGNAQAIMRVHRIGQSRTVRARFITLADSLDVAIGRIVSRKTAAIAGIEGAAMLATPMRAAR